jgi:NAD(P)-dependent dehydrogenase (short-subunit alcohol dehydrogenase family)
MVIVVTGGSRGIGKTILSYFSKNKSIRAINISRSKCNLKNVDNYKCDVSSYEEVIHTFKKIKKIDCLINNAGIAKASKNNYIQNFERIISVNLNSVFYCSHEAYKKFPKKGGSIINIASINAHMGFPSNPGYVSSKGGILSLTKALALDYSKKKIRVNSISPGYIKTDMTLNSYKDIKESKKRILRTISNRWGLPKDLIGIIELLVSEKSSYINGQDFIVDGGWVSKGL